VKAVKSWTDWEVVRHRVTISGRVLDEGKNPVERFPVLIASGPKAFESLVAAAAQRAGTGWNLLSERPDRKETRADGLYFFLDLPVGAYSVTGDSVLMGASGETKVSEKKVSVRAGSDGRVKVVVADLVLK